MPGPLVVALAGLAALAVAMGIGRFAFTPLLPMMQADAGLSLAAGGGLATANYAGYLAGALWATARPAPARLAVPAALVAIVIATFAMGAVQTFAAWVALRILAGVASAWVLIAVSAWALERLASAGRPALSSVVYAGVGAGIVLAGMACLALMSAGGSSGAAWYAMGGLALVLSASIWPTFRGRAALPALAPSWRPDREAWRLVLCYGAYGFGYIVPATFLPAMARDVVPDPLVFGWAWPVLGVAAALSTFVAARLLECVGNRSVWIGCHLVLALGVVAPLLAHGIAGVVASALCVGATFVVITMVALQEARAQGGRNGARLMGAMTAAFAAGQIAGPAFASVWLAAGGRLSGVLWIACAALVASALALLNKSTQEAGCRTDAR